MRFAALDFETATPTRSSACSLGVCVVEDSVIVETRTWLIRPPGNEYYEFNTRIHGLGPADTEAAEPFASVLNEAWGYLADKPLVAHNAAFDMSVLRSSLVAGHECPQAEYYCTMLLARAHWPELPSYSLPLVLAKCGMSHKHHDAGEDACAAASILLRMADDVGQETVAGLARELGVRAGRLEPWGYTPCSGPAPKAGRKEHFKISSLRSDTNASPDHPFFDMDIAFTGTLLSMTRPDAMKRVADHGGRPRTSVSRLTEFLVVGSVEYRSLVTGDPSQKMRTALELKNSGCPVIILSEQEFLEYL